MCGFLSFEEQAIVAQALLFLNSDHPAKSVQVKEQLGEAERLPRRYPQQIDRRNFLAGIGALVGLAKVLPAQDRPASTLPFVLPDPPVVPLQSTTGIQRISPQFNAWVTLQEAVRNHDSRFDELSLFAVQADKKGNLEKASGRVAALMEAASHLEPRPRLLITITNDRPKRNKDRKLIHRWIGNATARDRHIQDLLEWAREVDGLDIDYENFAAKDVDAFHRFVEELAAALHTRGKYLTVTVEPKMRDTSQSINWALLSRSADRIRVMGYQWHDRRTGPGAISPPDKVEQLTRFALTQVPADKLEIALGMYGFDWLRKGRATVIGSQGQFQSLSHYLNAETWRDPVTQSITTSYFVRKGRKALRHQAWFEDSASLLYKIKRLIEMGVMNIGLWQLGTGDLSHIFQELFSSPRPWEVPSVMQNAAPSFQTRRGFPDIGPGLSGRHGPLFSRPEDLDLHAASEPGEPTPESKETIAKWVRVIKQAHEAMEDLELRWAHAYVLPRDTVVEMPGTKQEVAVWTMPLQGMLVQWENIIINGTLFLGNGGGFASRPGQPVLVHGANECVGLFAAFPNKTRTDIVFIGRHFVAPSGVQKEPLRLHREFVEDTLTRMLLEADKMGVDLAAGGEAILFGGSDFPGSDSGQVGKANLAQVEAALDRRGIKILDKSETGGEVNRYGFFNGKDKVVVSHVKIQDKGIPAVSLHDYVVQFTVPIRPHDSEKQDPMAGHSRRAA